MAEPDITIPIPGTWEHGPMRLVARGVEELPPGGDIGDLVAYRGQVYVWNGRAWVAEGGAG